VGDLGGGVKRRAAAVQAWPAKGKLVKLAKACLPRPRAEQPFGCGSDDMLTDWGCRQIGGSLRGRAKTQVALRDRLPSASVLGWQSSRLPTDYVGMAEV
jgi:hypothetical protein